jgi:signal peptidase I
MAPEVVAGDYVLVPKPLIGARLFNLFKVTADEQPDIYRLPGLRPISRNDMLVFNFPCPKDWNRIEMSLKKYYIKRCIGMPGDTLTIDNGYYKVKGVDTSLGNMASQQTVSKRKDDTFEEGVFRSFPYDSVIDWNIKDFGPLYIPTEKAVIPMNRTHYVLYKKLIEWEQKGALSYQDSIVYLNGKPLHSYQFQKNYYFMAGDRVEDSQDSRYWGLLPEEYIVGKACLVWKSIDPYTGKFRWDRFLKRIN